MRSKIGIGIAVVALLAVTVFLVRRPRPAPVPVKAPAPATVPAVRPSAVPAAPSTTQQQLTSDIIQKGVTPERAQQLFSMVVGPLPGVSVPPGGRDPGDFDGTFAVRELYLVWDKLSPGQRKAAALLIDRPMATAGAAPAPRRTGSGASTGSGVRLLPAAYVSPAADTPAYDYDQLGVAANTELAPRLKQPFINVKFDIEYGAPTGTEYAHTTSWWSLVDNPNVPIFSEKKAYPDNSCHITVWNQKFQSINAADAQSIVVHEMFHCFQQRVAGTFAVDSSVAPWIIEGEATWAMGAVVPATHAILDEHWNGYVFGPQVLYQNRKYDAVGVFGHLGDLIANDAVWPTLLPVFVAGEGAQSIAAFNLLIKGHEDEFYSSWASSYFIVNGRAPWTMTGPADAPTSGPQPVNISVDNGTNEGLTPADPNTAQLFSLGGGADIAVVALYTGYGRLHDSGFGIDTEMATSAPVALCLRSGGCSCSDGTPGASLYTKQATAPISVGLEGGDTTGLVGVIGQSLDDFCKKPQEPNPPPDNQGAGSGGGSGGPGGGTEPAKPNPPPDGQDWGDTHLTTFDGLHYDFQVVGEYTLVRSTKDDFVVQVRQAPALGSRTASVTQAVATRLNGHRVTVTIENGAFTPRVDGTEVFGAPPPSVRGALSCPYTMLGYSCTLTWPDGTTLVASQAGKFVLNVDVRPAAARLGQLTGLLGDGNGSPANDLVGSNNVSLGVTPSPADINHSLADAWRVAPGASLLDYQPGQSSQTFVDPTFPSGSIDARNVPDRDAAEKTCHQEGITDKNMLADCILDLAVIKDGAMGSLYGHAQRVHDVRAALTAVSMPGIVKTLVLQGTISDKNAEPSLTFDIAPGDVIWIDPDDCRDANGAIHMHLLSPADLQMGWQETAHYGAVTTGGDPVPWDAVPCKAGRFGIIGQGKYEILLNPLKNATGDYRIPLRYVRHDRGHAVSYGDTISGRIENPAASDSYTFNGHAGDVVRLSGKDCELGGMLTGLGRPEGYGGQGPSCKPGSELHLNKDGQYTLVVNWYQTRGPGDYHFVLQGASTK